MPNDIRGGESAPLNKVAGEYLEHNAVLLARLAAHDLPLLLKMYTALQSTDAKSNRLRRVEAAARVIWKHRDATSQEEARLLYNGWLDLRDALAERPSEEIETR